MTLTIEQVMKHLPEAFVAEKAAGLKSTVQFEFGEKGTYVVHIADGKCDVTSGPIDQPDAIMITNAETYLAIIDGQQDAMRAFMGGKLKVKGNLNLLMKVQTLFDRSRVHG